MSALEIAQVHCSYNGVEILSDMSVTLESNEILCLLGSSGCGKTTLLKAIAGLLPLKSGDITINGRQVNGENLHLPAEQRKVGMIFQDYALFPHMTVMENVVFGIDHLSKAEQQQRANQVLALVKLSDFAERYPHQLSGGQQQRVAIARALAYQPDIMLLDEPFSNIDSQVRLELIAEIKRILKQAGISAVFVTHSKEEAFAFADKLAVLDQGRIIQVGTPDELYLRPATRFVANFLGGGNYLEAKVLDERHVTTSLGRICGTVAHHKNLGSDCEILLRPQQLSLALNPEGSGIVQEVQFLGASSKVVVNQQGQQLECQIAQPMCVQQKVDVTVQPHELIIFDKISA
ncbi:ABC transporter ATP-binding protein [Motilimonas sp. KMU-193]|uniref:ABC transporter ATP-binding protein n=1 Tax=Motilimonas sp. KMU-193 TaxID=3388668 RepID=UPI00396B3046